MALQADDRTFSGPRAAAAAGMLAGLLAGCNPSDRAPQAALQPGAGFFFNQDGPMASLAYGLADSDDVSLMLECELGSRRVRISKPADRVSGPARLILTSGDARSDLKADIEPNEESGESLASSRAPSDLPALAAFRKTGRLRVRVTGRDQTLAATPGERPIVARFFAACERR
jgi:hypothetical protein